MGGTARTMRTWMAAAVAGAATVAATAAPSANPTLVTRVPGNSGADGPSGWCAISPNGRYAAFESAATNLVNGDGNGATDVFVRDLKKGETALVSMAQDGTPANGNSYSPSVSANGKIVLFQSWADNLVDGDDNGYADVFAVDRRSGAVRLVSATPDGSPGNLVSQCYGACLSSNGRYAIFDSDSSDLLPGGSGGQSQVYLADLRKGTVVLVSRTPAGAPGGGSSGEESISANGRFVVFTSSAQDLVADDSGNHRDIFLYDVKAGTVSLVSRSAAGAPGNGDSYYPTLSKNGRTVAFSSYASDLVDGDTNDTMDVFVRDVKKGTTVRASMTIQGTEMATEGEAWTPSLSGNGKAVAFNGMPLALGHSSGDEGEHGFIADLKTGAVRLLTATPQDEVGDGYSTIYPGSLSGNGKWLIFSSRATNFSNQDKNGNVEDIYVVPAR